MIQFRHFYIIFFLMIISSCQISETSQELFEIDSAKVNKDSSDNVNLDGQIFDKVKALPIDTFHNALAQLISGIDYSYFEKEGFIDFAFWEKYSDQVGLKYAEMEKNRLDPMKKWMASVTTGQINDTCLLFYPFSGADFLHANYLFPEANDYLLLAQEKIGDLPDFNSMTKEETRNFLNAVDNSLGDIYKRSYFITKRMMNDTKEGEELSGLLPLFYWFIARTNHEIIDVVNIYINSEGISVVSPMDKKSPDEYVRGVKFLFRKRGSAKVKTMTYYKCDISNNGFEKKPEFKQYLDSIRTCNTFVKSASYLLHYGTFSEIRNLILTKSDLVLEDDTGIPYKYFNNKQWTASLFGTYVEPIKDFSEKLFQEDLNKAFKEHGKKNLPFSMGYHWGTKDQNQMLLVKIDTTTNTSSINDIASSTNDIASSTKAIAKPKENDDVTNHFTDKVEIKEEKLEQVRSEESVLPLPGSLEKKFYIIIGVFSKSDNAKNYQASQSRYFSNSSGIIFKNNLYYVYAFTNENERENRLKLDEVKRNCDCSAWVLVE